MRRFNRTRTVGLAGVSALALITAGGAWAQDAGALVLGEGLDASLEEGDSRDDLGAPYDSYTVTLVAGQRFEVEMRSDDFDAYLELYGPDMEEPVAVDDDSAGDGTDARLRYTATADGIYTVRARAFSEGAMGPYNLIARERPPAPPEPEPVALALGQSLDGVIDDADPVDDQDVPFDAYRFAADAGERVIVTLTSDDFDTYLQVGHLRDGVFEELAFNDDDGESLNSRLVFATPARGDYLIRVRPLSTSESGAYVLSLQPAPPPPEAARLTIGDSVTGTIDPDTPVNDEGYRARLYRFDGREGQRIDIRLEAEDFDTYLVLYRDDGPPPTRLDDNDDSDGTNSRLTRTLEGSGTYVIEVRGFSQTVEGDYTLSLAEIAPERPPVPIAFGAVQEGVIDDKDPLDGQDRNYDSFRFTGVEGSRVQVIARSGDFDTFLRLGSADGEFEALATDDDGLGEGTDSRLNFTIPEDGDYVIRLSPLSEGNEGLYSLELIDRGPAPVPGSILVGATARGTLGEADAAAGDGSYFDAYRIHAKAGETLVITMVSNAFDAFVIVGREKDGNDIEVLASDDDGLSDTHARLEWEVPDDGVYVIRAGSYGQSETGAYALKVERKP
ncbi:pre-peptidase C-terminal domain-containing protein [Brevundimonas sp.]|uniref:pre-peptidase C-terminal domain-containing protein n=1 Tax=Brevundimonas sp. TaxID=1871086 RepID=UPI003AF655F2